MWYNGSKSKCIYTKNTAEIYFQAMLLKFLPWGSSQEPQEQIKILLQFTFGAPRNLFGLLTEHRWGVTYRNVGTDHTWKALLKEGWGLPDTQLYLVFSSSIYSTPFPRPKAEPPGSKKQLNTQARISPMPFSVPLWGSINHQPPYLGQSFTRGESLPNSQRW